MMVLRVPLAVAGVAVAIHSTISVWLPAATLVSVAVKSGCKLAEPLGIATKTIPSNTRLQIAVLPTDVFKLVISSLAGTATLNGSVSTVVDPVVDSVTDTTLVLNICTDGGGTLEAATRLT